MNRIIVLPFSTGEIAVSGSWTSRAIDLSKLSNENRLSVQPIVTGDGTAKIEALASNNGVDFVDTENDIVTGLTVLAYAPIIITTTMLPYSRWLKLKVTETAGVPLETVTLDLSLFVQ
jgi:hypothetical protein